MPAESVHLKWKSTGLAHKRIVWIHASFLDYEIDSYEERMYYLVIATIMASLWVLKFLPDAVADYFWAGVLTIIIGNTILKFWDKRKKSHDYDEES